MSENASVSIESFTTPDTEKSTTLKPTKRKIENVVVENMASLNSVVEEEKEEKKLGSPPLVKNIKKERVSNTVRLLILCLVIAIITKNMIWFV